jgi:hypothetical protein
MPSNVRGAHIDTQTVRWSRKTTYIFFKIREVGKKMKACLLFQGQIFLYDEQFFTKLITFVLTLMWNSKFSYIGPKRNKTKFVGQNLFCTFHEKNWTKIHSIISKLKPAVKQIRHPHPYPPKFRISTELHPDFSLTINLKIKTNLRESLFLTVHNDPLQRQYEVQSLSFQHYPQFSLT